MAHLYWPLCSLELDHADTSTFQASISGCPIDLVAPEILRFTCVDMRIRFKGGGHTSQIYAIGLQSIVRALVAYIQKYLDEQAKRKI